jgi:hypothetical protein
MRRREIQRQRAGYSPVEIEKRDIDGAAKMENWKWTSKILEGLDSGLTPNFIESHLSYENRNNHQLTNQINKNIHSLS